jgi:hypothetical protein
MSRKMPCRSVRRWKSTSIASVMSSPPSRWTSMSDAYRSMTQPSSAATGAATTTSIANAARRAPAARRRAPALM